MKKAIATPPGQLTIYEDLTPAEQSQKTADEAAFEVEKSKPKAPTIPEMVEALIRDKEGDSSALDEVLSRRAQLG